MADSVSNQSDLRSFEEMGKESIGNHLNTKAIEKNTDWSNTVYSDEPLSLSNNQPTKSTPSTSPQINDNATETFWDINDNHSNIHQQTDISKCLQNDNLSKSPSTSSNTVVANQSQSATMEATVEQQHVLHTNSIINNDVTNNIVNTSDDDTRKNSDNLPVTIANLASMPTSDEISQQIVTTAVSNIKQENSDSQQTDQDSVTLLETAAVNGSASLSQKEYSSINNNSKKSDLTLNLVQQRQSIASKSIDSSSPKLNSVHSDSQTPTGSKTNFTLEQLMSTKASNQKLLAEQLSVANIGTKDIKLYANNLTALLINTKKNPEVKQQQTPVADTSKTTSSTIKNRDSLSSTPLAVKKPVSLPKRPMPLSQISNVTKSTVPIKTPDKASPLPSTNTNTSLTPKFTPTSKSLKNRPKPSSKNAKSDSRDNSTTNKSSNQGKKRPPPTAAAKQAKRAARITTALGVDQIFVESPEMKPFESFENACRELLRYHVYYEPLPEDEDIAKFDEAYEFTSMQTMHKIQRMYNKFTRLLYEDSKLYAPSAERVLMDRIFLADERKDFEQIRKETMDKFAESAGTVLATLSTSGTVADSTSESTEPTADAVDNEA